MEYIAQTESAEGGRAGDGASAEDASRENRRRDRCGGTGGKAKLWTSGLEQARSPVTLKQNLSNIKLLIPESDIDNMSDKHKLISLVPYMLNYTCSVYYLRRDR